METMKLNENQRLWEREYRYFYEDNVDLDTSTYDLKYDVESDKVVFIAPNDVQLLLPFSICKDYADLVLSYNHEIGELQSLAKNENMFNERCKRIRELALELCKWEHFEESIRDFSLIV